MSEAEVLNDIEDLEICAQEGRNPRAGARIRFRVNDQLLLTRDPLVTGQQILDLAQLNPVGDYLLIQFLISGQLEEIRLDELVDLRINGIEQFLAFKTDRSFRFKIEDRVFSWGSNLISGKWLFKLARINPEELSLWLLSVGGKNRLIEIQDQVDLNDPELECFKIENKFSICIEGKIFPWPTPTITTEEIIKLGGWDPSQGAIEVLADQSERTLQPGEEIDLKPGRKFCKKQSFKRG